MTHERREEGGRGKGIERGGGDAEGAVGGGRGGEQALFPISQNHSACPILRQGNRLGERWQLTRHLTLGERETYAEAGQRGQTGWRKGRWRHPGLGSGLRDSVS